MIFYFAQIERQINRVGWIYVCRANSRSIFLSELQKFDGLKRIYDYVEISAKCLKRLDISIPHSVWGDDGTQTFCYEPFSYLSHEKRSSHYYLFEQLKY